MRIHVGINSIEDSNMFLRALWSQLRKNEENFAWNYIPRRDGERKSIEFGFLSCGNLKHSYYVNIKYKTKGNIEFIEFDSLEEESEKDKRFITKCVNNALDYNNLLEQFTVYKTYKTVYCSLENYVGENFKIEKCKGKNKFNITIRCQGFDHRDMEIQCNKIYNIILDFLSACSNSVYYNSKIEENDLSITGEINSFIEEKWIDGAKTKLPKKALAYMDKIIDKVTDFEKNEFLNACRIYHLANKYLSFKYDFDYYNFSLVNLGIYNDENINVMYMSVLEILSNIDNSRVMTCDKCGQPVYSIKKRVSDLINKYSDEYMSVNDIKDYYDDRSAYVHAGAFFSNNSYTGHVNPQLEIKDGKYIPYSPISMKNIIYIKEVTGYILRNYFIESIKI